jgi:S-adenosylmethionine synthetase
VRDTVRAIGYDDPTQPFAADTLRVTNLISSQSTEIDTAVTAATDATEKPDQGAGDQGIMFGYATDETDERMPLPILLAHRLAEGLARDRRAGTVPFLRPDGKTQVSVRYEDGRPREVIGVLVSTQHTPDVDQKTIRDYVVRTLVPRELGTWYRPGIEIIVNPSGSFVHGGPSADAGVTGRKIIVDTYGGAARHGGGAFSGKDPSKVDRSAAYFCRWAARQVVNAGLAKRAEIQVSYAIGHSRPMSVYVDTFGTGDPAAARAHVAQFDFSPARIIEKLELKRPIYRATTNYGHFGKAELPWEK